MFKKFWGLMGFEPKKGDVFCETCDFLDGDSYCTNEHLKYKTPYQKCLSYIYNVNEYNDCKYFKQKEL